MFDRLIWWQLLLVLAPIVATMTFIRHREAQAQGLKFDQLDNAQKVWIFLTMLPPGDMARLLNEMKPDDRDELMARARELEGNRRTVLVPVAKEFLVSLGETKKVKNSEAAEMIDYICLHFNGNMRKLMTSLRKCWPT